MRASEEAEASEEGAESTENLGVRLRLAREAQELSIDAIAAELRIPAPSLSALEECRFEALGAPVFAKGYLKQYGARLGLKVDELVAEYERSVATTGVEIAPSKSITLRDERQITIWIVALIALVLVAAVLGIWWWLGSQGTTDQASLTVPIVTETPQAGLDASEASQAVGVPQTESAVTQAETAGSPEALTEAPAEAPAEAATEAETEAPTQTPTATESTAEAADNAAGADASPFAGPMLEIEFIEDSWTDITDATGQRLYYGLGQAGARATVPVDRPLNVFFGYADGVLLSIDGEPLPIPRSARRDDLAQFDIEARPSQDP